MNQRLPTVDALRGIASLAVCWFHLNLNSAFIPNGVVRTVGDHGWLGVEVFFVVSGFVIPYSLYNGRYELRFFKIFVTKRIVRLDPPYLASIVLMLVLGVLTLKLLNYRIEAFNTSSLGLLLHLGYLNVIAGYPWLNPVYWTLAIEFQYYLLIGLIYPLIASPNRLYRYTTFVTLGVAAVLIKPEAFLPHWLLLFLLGIATFNFIIKLIGRFEYLVIVTSLSAALFATALLPIAIAGIATALVIAFVRINSRVLGFFGAISYSLYLLHTAFGAKPLKLISMRTGHLYSVPLSVAIMMFFMVVCIVASYLFYRFIEKPSQQWSAKIRYRTSEAKRQAAFAAASATSVP
ncbi:MAG TPA: acyltransferase [Blastocatellia bacterium]|nr:acyltransferase [Blastocatellia bacterium]